MITLHKWVLCKADLKNLVCNPDFGVPFLFGEVKNQPRFRNGEGLYTAPVLAVDRTLRQVSCKDGITYQLGEVSPLYEKDYPGAESRFFNHWCRDSRL